jgi:two-component system, NarL family, sensor kinase
MIRVLILLLISAISFAQQSEIDSLLQQSDIQQGEEKVNTLINISRQYFINQDTLAIKFGREAIRLSDSLGYEEGVGKAMLFMGLTWADIEPDSALRYYLKSSEILLRLDHSWAQYGYRNASDIFISKGWFPEALDCVLKVFEINEKTGDTLLMVESLSTLGFLHNNIGNYNEALMWQRKALETLGDIQNDTRWGIIFGRIGVIYDEIGNFDSALYYNNLAIEYFTKNNDEIYLAQWLSNIANTNIKMGNFSQAESLLLEALSIEITDDRRPNMLNNLAKVYTETKRYPEAKNALDSSYYYAKRLHLKDVESEVWFRKYELHKARGRINDALDAYIRYSSLKDSILNEKKTEQVAQMLVRYETEGKEKALLQEKAETARLEKEKVQAQLSANRTQQWIRGITFLSILLIISILLLMLRTKRKAQIGTKLAISQEQKKSLVALINAQEEERKRVAKDLHDGIGQQISAISLNFQVLARKLVKEYPELNAEMEKIKHLILDTSHEIRAVSHQMMPRALTHFGLVDAIEDMIDTNFKNSNIICHFNHQNMHERLAQEIEIGLYRITQELVSNIIRHSQAKVADIQLYRTDSTCVLCVSDDGIGMNLNTTSGIGITNISSRVNSLRGQLEVKSNPGSGTAVTIKIMLQNG